MSMAHLIYLYEEQSSSIGACSPDPSFRYTCALAIRDGSLYLDLDAYTCEMCYKYWIDKRIKLGKALMRKFQNYQLITDANLNAPFRSRCKEAKMATRKSLKD
eukprot:UN26329